MNKSELLNWLQEEYQRWEALLDEIGPTRMDQPGVAGHWSMKDIVAHLIGWQPKVNASIQAAQRGEPEPPPPWPVHLVNSFTISVMTMRLTCFYKIFYSKPTCLHNEFEALRTSQV